LFARKGKRQELPALQLYADHLRDERSRVFDWRTPPESMPYPLTASTTYAHAARLPGKRLVFPVLPMLVSDDCPGSVVIAPWQVWPAGVFAQWAEALKDECPYLEEQPGLPPEVSSPTAEQAEEGERLYVEGVAFWHGTHGARRDEARAIAKWEEAAARHHYLALCALGSAIKGDRAAYPDDATYLDAMETMSSAIFRAWAIAEYRLGFVEAAKLHLRPDRPDAREGDKQARELLQLASRLGDARAAQMLKVLARMPPR
jgi:hypothetical protein